MAGSELVHVPAIEDELDNKREINRRSSNGITVVAYYLMREQVALIYIHDARVNQAAEYEVDPSEVMEEFNHPFANPNSWGITEYRQSENDDGA